jgi:ribosomal protein S6
MDRKNTYEGMFLVDAGNPDFEAAGEPIRSILERREAEILALKPWDERKLAYRIAGRKRGLYALSYFKVAPAHIAEIEHDCQLDERILRVLILKRDGLTEEEIAAETPAMASARRRAASKGGKGSGGEGKPDRPRRRPGDKASADEDKPGASGRDDAEAPAKKGSRKGGDEKDQGGDEKDQGGSEKDDSGDGEGDDT